eukprot:364139-Chlamydomonas_euryale.AAC.7
MAQLWSERRGCGERPAVRCRGQLEGGGTRVGLWQMRRARQRSSCTQPSFSQLGLERYANLSLKKRRPDRQTMQGATNPQRRKDWIATRSQEHAMTTGAGGGATACGVQATNTPATHCIWLSWRLWLPAPTERCGCANPAMGLRQRSPPHANLSLFLHLSATCLSLSRIHTFPRSATTTAHLQTPSAASRIAKVGTGQPTGVLRGTPRGWARP